MKYPPQSPNGPSQTPISQTNGFPDGRPGAKAGLEGALKHLRPPPTQETPRKQWSVSQFKVPPVEGKTRFHDFNLPDALMHAICDLGFQYCTPIQAEILPSSLAGKMPRGAPRPVRVRQRLS